MLCVNGYPQHYIDQCKSKVKQQLKVYKDLVVAATSGHKIKDTNISATVESFEPAFFNNMVLVLDSYFVHRSRTIKRDDGNPLNEVRALSNSIVENPPRPARGQSNQT